MSVSTLEPPARTARYRRSRTRTKNVSSRPALAVSALRPHQYDLRPDCASLICPDCRTWVPITGIRGKTPKLVPHDAGTAGVDAPVRCSLGTNRRVIIDVRFEVWQRRLEQGGAETDGRRSNRVTRKPRVAVAPAVTQIIAPLLDAKAALALYRAHRKGCTVCTAPGHNRCTDGGRLAHLYAHKQRSENRGHGAALTLQQQLEGEEDRRERGFWLLRELQWASTADEVRRVDIQRVHDALEMKLKQLSPKLNPWQHADLESAIEMLAQRLKQLRK